MRPAERSNSSFDVQSQSKEPKARAHIARTRAARLECIERIYSTRQLFAKRQAKRSSNTRKQHQERATHLIIISRESVSELCVGVAPFCLFLSQRAQSATSAYGSSVTNVAIAARTARIDRPADARSPRGPASFADARAPIFIVALVRAGETFAAAFRARLCRIFRRRNALVAFAAALVLVLIRLAPIGWHCSGTPLPYLN